MAISTMKLIKLQTRTYLSLFWICAIAYAYPIIWKLAGNTERLPFTQGLNGLTDLWIGVPTWILVFVSACYVTAIYWASKKSVALVHGLFLLAGALMATGLILMWYVSSGGGVGILCCGIAMINYAEILHFKSGDAY